MEPLLLALPIAVAQAVAFYVLHWPYRHLLRDRFRTALMAKGLGKAFSYLCLTALAAWLTPVLGWVLAVGQPLIGGLLHVWWCRAHGVDPVRVQPREQYVLATTAWVDKLIAYEEERKRRVLLGRSDGLPRTEGAHLTPRRDSALQPGKGSGDPLRSGGSAMPNVHHHEHLAATVCRGKGR